MPDYVDMPTTLWTLIGRARGGDAGELDRLLRRYWPPVLAFVRNSIRDRGEAEDVVQEVFLTILRDGVLDKADRGRGKFRSLVLAVARYTLSARHRAGNALKRGGGARPLPLDAQDGASLENHLEAASEDESFDALWVENLVRLGMARVREECRKDGTRYFEALFAHVNDGLDYEGISRKLQVSGSDVKNWIHQARLRLRRHILQEIQDYSTSRTDWEAEVAYLRKFLE